MLFGFVITSAARDLLFFPFWEYGGADGGTPSPLKILVLLKLQTFSAQNLPAKGLRGKIGQIKDLREIR